MLTQQESSDQFARRVADIPTLHVGIDTIPFKSRPLRMSGVVCDESRPLPKLVFTANYASYHPHYGVVHDGRRQLTGYYFPNGHDTSPEAGIPTVMYRRDCSVQEYRSAIRKAIKDNPALLPGDEWYIDDCLYTMLSGKGKHAPRIKCDWKPRSVRQELPTILVKLPSGRIVYAVLRGRANKFATANVQDPGHPDSHERSFEAAWETAANAINGWYPITC